MLSEIERADAEYNCLRAGTPVVLEDGSTVLIETLVRQRRAVRILSWDPRVGICSRPVVDWHKKRVPGQQWIQIKTRACHEGRGLLVTPDHEVYLESGKRLPAAQLKVGMRVLLPEQCFSSLQRQAILGTLLGDSRLCNSPTQRHAALQASSAYLDGGHVEECGLAQHKAEFLAPFVELSPLQPRGLRRFGDKECIAAPFRPFRSRNLWQLQELRPLFQYPDGSRALKAEVLDAIGPIGLAWWFMDDGCLQKWQDKQDTVTLALCRYNEVDIADALVWFRKEFGQRIYCGADRVLRFSADEAYRFCSRIAAHVIEGCRYKLPRDFTWPEYQDQRQLSSAPQPASVEVSSVDLYAECPTTPNDRLRAETRFCITVAGTHNFFTSFGLVRNCRDTLAMNRMMPHLWAEITRTSSETVYAYDELMADLALQMTRIGMPVNIERREEIGKRLYALRDQAIAELTPFTEGEYREPFLDWVATFFAKTVRNGEPKGGTVRVGPTAAARVLEEVREALAGWKAFKKNPPPAPDPNNLQASADWDQATAVADSQIALYEGLLKAAKKAVQVAQFVTDEEDGLPHTDETATAVRRKIRRAEAELAIAKKGVNFGAKVQQAAILRAAGVPLHRVTEKTGLPKIDKEVLEAYKRHTAARALLSYILVRKTIETYIEGEKRAGKKGDTRAVTVSSDGYLHPLWTVHKITGRWGSSPNVQNWSKRAGGGAENLRSMIEAPEGYTLVGADQKQLEARLIGGMAQCKLMIDCFRNGDDIHSLFAGIGFPNEWPRLAKIFKEHKAAAGGKCKCADCQNRNKMRDRTKNLEYGAFYGGKEDKLFEAIAKDFAEATLGQVREFLARFNAMLPEVLAWREKTLKEAIQDGEIRSPILGRRQVFPLGRVDPNVAYNYKAQSGGADLWAIGAGKFMEKWDQWEFDARIIHNGHDSVLILCREELAAEVEQDVYACWNMEWNGVPFEMECQTAKQWSET